MKDNEESSAVKSDDVGDITEPQPKNMKRKLKTRDKHQKTLRISGCESDDSNSSGEESQSEENSQAFNSQATSKAGMYDETDLGTSNAGGSLGWSVDGSLTSQSSLRPIIPTEILSSDTSVESSHEAGNRLEDIPSNPRSVTNRTLKSSLQAKLSASNSDVENFQQ